MMRKAVLLLCLLATLACPSPSLSRPDGRGPRVAG